MPVISDTPDYVKSYKFLGLDLPDQINQVNVYTDCPFCGKENKFAINVSNGQWRCFVCCEGGNKTAGGGNIYSFFKLLYQRGQEETTKDDYLELAKQRGLLFSSTLKTWGFFKSIITNDWLLAGFSLDKKITNLYRYTEIEGKRRLLACAGMKHTMFGIHLHEEKKAVNYLCEGPWDAMILWEVLGFVGRGEDEDGEIGYVEMVDKKKTLLSNANVLAVPGCTTFLNGWEEPFKDRTVYICYDSDHPKRHPKTNKILPPVGTEGVKRVANTLSASSVPPMEINYLCWGEEGYDPKLPSGTDLRDLFQPVKTKQGRIEVLKRIISQSKLVPTDWMKTKSDYRASDSVEHLVQPMQCEDWGVLDAAWQDAMQFTSGLRKTLICMLASIASTNTIGDQLWLRVIGPASCGKSTLCEALAVARKYIVPKSTLRGFHSGYKSDSDGTEDNSLLALCKDKTLVLKDGDTLLTSPNREQILGEARDVYDRVSRVHYRNQINRNYEAVNLTWILCGTSSLRSLDTSELGERFITVIVEKDTTLEFERRVRRRIGYRIRDNLGIETKGDPASQYPPKLLQAMQLTGGYISYLRSNASVLLSELTLSDDAIDTIGEMAEFVSFMRARPSVKQNESVERELSYRLTSQLLRLATCAAIVLGKKTVDTEVIELVREVAMDTAEGRVYNIIKELITIPRKKGSDTSSLAILTHDTEPKCRELLKFLRRLGAVEAFRSVQTGGLKMTGPIRWRLTERMGNLFRTVVKQLNSES